ncbi:hypothetical protein RhiirA5_454156 [Rhizophagus irregularis]|uniref:Uncharacterized protein n=1 Tax=Rhizophagus irregularis TaxID=588596 RepID=A0A2N0Q5J6_9GLOM|nr:hypothetical protein RhiirA5_454156 [Rhizophagus irregularis]
MAKDVKKIASTTCKKMTGGKSKFASKTKSKKKKKKSYSSKRINSYTISDESFSESSSNDDDATSSKDKLETNALVHGEEIAFKSSKRIPWLDRTGWEPIAKWEFNLLYKELAGTVTTSGTTQFFPLSLTATDSVNPKNVHTYATVLGVGSGSVIGVWKAVESSVGKMEERLEKQINNKMEGRINQRLNKTDVQLLRESLSRRTHPRCIN